MNELKVFDVEVVGGASGQRFVIQVQAPTGDDALAAARAQGHQVTDVRERPGLGRPRSRSLVGSVVAFLWDKFSLLLAALIIALAIFVVLGFYR